MKTIGLIGGTGWISTLEYYKYINEMTNAQIGGFNSAKCLLYSFNYAEINELNNRNDPRGVYQMLLNAAGKLEAAGAECLLLCANTLHQFADELAAMVGIPLINIADATAVEINRRKFQKVGLLGTRITMEKEFYKDRLHRAGIDVLIPPKDDRDFIHETILRELLKNVILENSRDRFLHIIGDLRHEGAEAVILGCTEIPLLVRPEDTDLPLFDTIKIHCRAAVDYSLSAD